MDSENLTPLLRQYLNIKKEHKDAILFFRMGDFYEMFYDDAVTASKVLEIALTTRDKRTDNPVPLCGIPYHAINSYLPKLIKEGYRVAVCEQVENPALTKGIVKREVVRVITPGTVLDNNLLDSKDNNFIASIFPAEKITGIAYVDVSTGDFFIAELPSTQVNDEMARIDPREIIVPQNPPHPHLNPLPEGEEISLPFKGRVREGMGFSSNSMQHYIHSYPPEMFEYEKSYRTLLEHLKENTAELVKIDIKGPSINAAGALLNYLFAVQKTSLLNINNLMVYRREQYMTLDEIAQRTLELVKSSQSGQKKGTLFHLLDKTITPMGSRMLKLWILNPILEINEIITRQDAVEELKNNFMFRTQMRTLLSNIQDMERIISRITLKAANARDLMSLKQCLADLPEIKRLLSEYPNPLIKETGNSIDTLDNLLKIISDAISDSPPLSLTDGGIIKDGYNRELDELREISRDGKGGIARLEAKEKERTGIDSLKVRYNRVFGFYIELTKSNLKNIPLDYIRKQTLVNAERFITPELKEYENRVLGAEEKIKALEYQLFEEIRASAAGEVEKVQRSARAVALTDVISSLAEVAHLYHYVRPVIDNSLQLSIIDGRHPVIEQINSAERFVPNDADMDCDKNQLMILTGPNMAGKSTYMRQVALIVLMAQMGGFVPAKEATIGVVDRIFTRIGASDNLAEGRSTFMVEMEETANILRNATHRSLIILDEIGRGTSTFDGISIAWASAEYINKKIKAKTLFATHYNELTELALTSEGIFNLHIAVREWNDEVIFIRKVLPGMADKSYGVQVARLAGLPHEVITRAKEVLYNLENEELDSTGSPRLAHTNNMEDKKPVLQIDLFNREYRRESEPHPVLEEIKGLDIMNMTPLQAFAKLEELKRKAAT
ncbi:MAG: DNA mismatch repair protein MutS [Nitrospira sp.]|nr:DNA mismatch repair protein MutS [Nitrospira sp.]